jgi:hypothetical protein
MAFDVAGDDRNGKPPFPCELGGKDTVYVGENETVRVVAKFGAHPTDLTAAAAMLCVAGGLGHLVVVQQQLVHGNRRGAAVPGRGCRPTGVGSTRLGSRASCRPRARSAPSSACTSSG